MRQAEGRGQVGQLRRRPRLFGERCLLHQRLNGEFLQRYVSILEIILLDFICS